MRIEPVPPMATVDGWPINLPNQTETVEAIIAAARTGAGFTLFTLNLDHLVKLRTSAAFRRAYSAATFVTADGAPVARLARRHDPAIVRTTGADLVLPLAAACAEAKIPIYLFGTTPGVLAKAGRRLVRDAGAGLDIVGSQAPAKNFDPAGEEAAAAIRRIARSGARICLVALGAPKQELFAARAAAMGVAVGFVCIGASLDFLAGAQTRAPRSVQTLGLEWLWRLGSNPRRLALRYVHCGLLLARLTVREPLASLWVARRAA